MKQEEYYNHIRSDLVDLIDFSNEELSILDIGCGTGATLKYIKSKYPNTKVYGIDSERKLDIKSDPSLNITIADAQMINFIYDPETFDYIILGDIIEHLKEPLLFLHKVRNLLKNNGHIVCSIPNVANAKIIYELLHNQFTYTEVGLLDYAHLRFFTSYSFWDILEKSGFSIKKSFPRIVKGFRIDDYGDFFDNILSIEGVASKQCFDAYQILFDAVKEEINNDTLFH